MISTLKVPANKRDHHLGSLDSPVVLVEFGDYECPYSAKASGIVRSLIEEFKSDLCFVFRNFPLTEKHQHSVLAALTAEAANEQGRFWEMHHLLFNNYDSLSAEGIKDFAEDLGLDVEKFLLDLERDDLLERIRIDLEIGEESGVQQTPTFFINGIKLDEQTSYRSLKEGILEVLREDRPSP